MASEDHPDPGPPLWSIGLVVAIMLGAPLLIYSISPAGPIREGDTIFPSGAGKVALVNPLLYERGGYEGTCLLDAKDPLIVIQRPEDRPDGLVLARVQGKTVVEWPFCPPQADILLSYRQIVQKPDLWTDWRTRLVNLFR